MRTLVRFTLAALAAVGVYTSQGQFRAGTFVVRLEVSVADDRRAVHGLLAKDFVVEDRGVRQTVRIDEVNDAPLELVLVAPPLSTVSFTAADQVDRLVLGVAAFLGLVQERDRLGVMLAAAPPRLLRPLAAGRPTFGTEVLNVGSGHYSASWDAIALGLSLFVG